MSGANRITTLAIVIALLVSGVSAIVLTAETTGADRNDPTHPPHTNIAASTIGYSVEATAAAESARAGLVSDYVRLVTINALMDYLKAAREAQAAQKAAREAQAAKASPSHQVPTSGGAAIGSCTGFGVPDSVIQRESGGNPNAVNSSTGAYGCTQIMPSWWSGACSGLDKHTVEGQRACTQIILQLQGPSAWGSTW